MANIQDRFIADRIKWNHDELVLVLAYYYFIYQTNTRKQDYEAFADDLRKMTGNKRSDGSVGMRFANFNSVDPSKSSEGFGGGDKQCKPIWDECITKTRTPKNFFINKFYDFIRLYGRRNLKIYDPFLNKYGFTISSKDIDSDDFDGIVNSDEITDFTFSAPKYVPKDKAECIDIITKRYKRDSSLAKNAIVRSDFKCDLDKSHVSFIAKNGKQYMEAHHLIPFSSQDDFKNSLDVDANIVCLCPNCHKMLHYGKTVDGLILKLFTARKEALKSSGIIITEAELLKYYK